MIKNENLFLDKEYVKNVVSYYRQELDKYSEKSSSGKIIYPFIADTERTFNRGYTNYFLESRKDCFNFISPKSRGKYIGKCFRKNGKLFVETKQELLPQDGLCFISNKKMEGFLINKVEKTDNGYFIYPNRTLNVPNSADIYRNVDTMFKKTDRD